MSDEYQLRKDIDNLERMQRDIDKINSNLEDCVTKDLNSFQLRIINNDLTKVNEDLDDVSDGLELLDGQLQVTDASLETTRQSLTQLITDLGALETSLGELDTQLNTTDSSLSTLTTRFNTLNDKLSNANTGFDATRTDLSNLSSRLTTLTTRLDNLGDSLDDFEGLLDDFQEELDAKGISITGLNDSISGIQTNIRDVKDSVYGTDGEKNNLKNDGLIKTVETVQDDIETNQSDISDVQVELYGSNKNPASPQSGSLVSDIGNAGTNINTLQDQMYGKNSGGTISNPTASSTKGIANQARTTANTANTNASTAITNINTTQDLMYGKTAGGTFASPKTSQSNGNSVMQRINTARTDIDQAQEDIDSFQSAMTTVNASIYSLLESQYSLKYVWYCNGTPSQSDFLAMNTSYGFNIDNIEYAQSISTGKTYIRNAQSWREATLPTEFTYIGLSSTYLVGSSVTTVDPIFSIFYYIPNGKYYELQNGTWVQLSSFFKTTKMYEEIDSEFAKKTSIPSGAFATTKTISANTNLNDVKTAGYYECVANATVATLTNCPTVYAFAMIVVKYNGNYVRQILMPYSGTNEGSARTLTFVRDLPYGQSVWGEWRTLEDPIGGTNLLKGTQDLLNITPSNSSSYNRDVTMGDNTVIDITATSSNYSDMTWVIDPELFTYGDVFTFSFWATSDSDSPYIYTYFYGDSGYITVRAVQSNGYGRGNAYGDGSCRFNLTLDWKKYYVTYKLNSTGTATVNKKLAIRVPKGLSAKIHSPKLERGWVATDWSLNPNDGVWLALPITNIVNNYSGQAPYFRKNGNIVSIHGAVSPKSAFTPTSDSSHAIAQLPSCCAPTHKIDIIQQGSEAYRWNMRIDSDGVIYASRYTNNTTTNQQIPASSWLKVNCTYMI